MQRWLAEAENDGWAAERGIALRAADVAARAAALQASFNRRFWYADGGYLYDVVDGEGSDGAGPRDDASLRPNQLLAISLPHPVLDPEHWSAVLDVVARTAGDAVWPALAGARAPRLQAALRRRSARARRRLSPGHGVGLAGRSVRRRLAQGSSRRHRGRRSLAGRPGRAAEQVVHRHDQRDLRRRAAVRAARLHGAGLERRRSVARARI